MVGRPAVSSKPVLLSLGMNLILVIDGLVAVPEKSPEIVRLDFSLALMPLLASTPVPPNSTVVAMLLPVKVQVLVLVKPA